MSPWAEVKRRLAEQPKMNLGQAITNAYLNDPRMLGFICARYKFVAKMLAGMPSVLEIGCGEGFGAPIVAQMVINLDCTDTDWEQIRDNESRELHTNIGYYEHNFCLSPVRVQYPAAYMIDVIEHVQKWEEGKFLKNVCSSLTEHGILLIGTPNKYADCYASELSNIGHVNTKYPDELRDLGNTYFHNTFMFSMNDEVVHTGFAPMAHYLWMLGVSPR